MAHCAIAVLGEKLPSPRRERYNHFFSQQGVLMMNEFERGAGTGRHVSATVIGSLVTALAMASAVPAQATPNTAKAWGDNQHGQRQTCRGSHDNPASQEIESHDAPPLSQSDVLLKAAIGSGTEVLAESLHRMFPPGWLVTLP